MLGYFDQNIIEAINKLEEIKDKGRDAVAKKSAMFSLVSSVLIKDLPVEAYNLYNQASEITSFAVEEEPSFPMGSLLRAQVGIGLIITEEEYQTASLWHRVYGRGQKEKLVFIFKELSKTAMTAILYADLQLAEQGFNSSISTVINSAPKSETEDKTHGFLTVIKYHSYSDQYPDGHYDVQINNQTLRITSEDKSCLFHAFARGLKPASGEEEITLEANRLRSVEADTLLKHSDQWEPFIKRKEQTEAIRGGDWFMAEGAARPAMKKMKETKNVLEKEECYNDWKKYADQNRGIGQFIKADHQPPVRSILEARSLNQNSKLAEAMLEVAKNSGLELPTVYVPAEIHHEFPSTLSPSFRTSLATAMSKDDVVGTFKLTMLGAMPRSMWNRDFQNAEMSKTRLAAFEDSLETRSIKMVQEWFDLLQGKGVMDDNHVTTLTTWITNQGYKDQNDPHRKQVSNLL
ncbi:hypothetical protein NFI96_027533 [Prochilodus magdalenae]|nr:hypothetical protein NFI96_027533 [Prochilodus magdalenae]